MNRDLHFINEIYGEFSSARAPAGAELRASSSVMPFDLTRPGIAPPLGVQRQSQNLLNIGVGDGGQGDTFSPPKLREKYFSGNYYVKFVHLSGKIM